MISEGVDSSQLEDEQVTAVVDWIDDEGIRERGGINPYLVRQNSGAAQPEQEKKIESSQLLKEQDTEVVSYIRDEGIRKKGGINPYVVRQNFDADEQEEEKKRTTK